MNDEQADIPPEGLPDRRKHGYKELEQKLEEHVSDIEKHQKKVFLGGLIMIAIIGITTAASIFAFGIILEEQAEQAQTIQEQRELAYRTICENQNQNNLKSRLYLNQRPLGEQERQNIKNLIDVIIPVQDCDDVVKEMIKPIPRR